LLFGKKLCILTVQLTGLPNMHPQTETGPKLQHNEPVSKCFGSSACFSHQSAGMRPDYSAFLDAVLFGEHFQGIGRGEHAVDPVIGGRTVRIQPGGDAAVGTLDPRNGIPEGTGLGQIQRA
jgi:hypothetical protein